MDNLLSGQQILEGGKLNASILHEMPFQEGNERRQGYHHEERPAGDSGCVPVVWDKDVQDR